ncbi:hypothetical protein TraAM80_01380 [Trypanosoma rangeli]|uniref:Uncharacterized protein n=1 Tax=Trypanosoma rangeli TaxID=5698 RepID=A0A3R7LB69_TRYRA|nr:uncharacterized protein TraAM80_01380 [Trypanosoma rangeli]RNF10834.1 hypothetical protein TraAM80_01380 [Trypanosoma rangeli]|eukprot:RNF10834.1 hypothetical protein TraAM80_01380 [Trypanosoma rangeli]
MQGEYTSCSCSVLTESCSCSERTHRSDYDGGCSCSSARHSASSSQSCSAASLCSCCSCSVYPSCYYCSDTASSFSTTDSRNRAAPYSFRKELLMEVPRLLHFYAVPLPLTTAMEHTEQSVGAVVVPPALSPPPLPYATPLAWTRANRLTVSTQTEGNAPAKIFCHTPSLQRSIGTWTTSTMTTRATSPITTFRVSAANNTEITGEQWEGQTHELLRKTTLLQEHSQRNDFLEGRHVSMELALAAAHERIGQEKERHQTTVSCLTAMMGEHRLELQRFESTCRQRLLDHEAESRSMLCALQEGWGCATRSALQTRSEHEQSLHVAQRCSQLQEDLLQQLLQDEVRHRDEVNNAEWQFRLLLWELFVFAQKCQRESFHAVTAVNLAVEEKHAAVLAKTAVEDRLRGALEREKELRRQYLHALHLPTTTIVSCSHPSNTAASAEEDVPVHARFARAHREAAEAVRAQRRFSVGQLHVF